jgi:non-ribosomal peptide synthetase component E (peptide arylation enzyme)
LPNELKNPIDKIELLSPSDRDDIWTWNSNIISLCDDGLVHNAISSRAPRDPERQAICAWDGELSYSDLEEISTKIAHALYKPEFGICGGDIVAVHFEKFMWMPVFMTALLKLGATVV